MESKIDLIAKLLAKAESTTPEEAEALTEHAARLMLKYGIEQARIDEQRARLGGRAESIVETRIIWTGLYARAMLDLAAAVALALGTIRPLQSVRGDRVVVFLVGFESDVAQAETLIRSLEVQSAVALRTWWAEARDAYRHDTDRAKKNARVGFLRGFGEGAARRIRENRRQVVEEAGSGTDLVLASRLQRVDAQIGDLPEAKDRRKQLDVAAFLGGRAAGENANTGERAVTQGRALTAS